MMRRALALVVLAGASACSGNAHPAPYDFGPEAGTPATPNGALVGDIAVDAGLDAASDAPGDAAADAADAGIDAADAAISYGLCDPTAAWKSGVLLPASTVEDDALGSLSSDELTIAWTSGSEGSSAVHYADRLSTTVPFGAVQTAAGTFAFDRAALSPDGLRLTVTNADRKGFSQLTRLARSATFGAAAVGPYAALNDFGASTMPAAEHFGDPMLSPNDKRFYFSRYGGGRTDTIFASNRIFTNDAWGEGTSLGGPSELVAVGGTRKRPTGVSADGRAFFFWDETASTERVAWYVPTTYAFEKVVDLGARAMAQPNAQCDRLYYSGAGSTNVDLFSADRN